MCGIISAQVILEAETKQKTFLLNRRPPSRLPVLLHLLLRQGAQQAGLPQGPGLRRRVLRLQDPRGGPRVRLLVRLRRELPLPRLLQRRLQLPLRRGVVEPTHATYALSFTR